MEKTEKSYHVIFVALLCLYSLSHGMGLLRELFYVLSELGTSYNIYNIIVHIVGLIIVFLFFAFNKAGYYIFVAIQILNPIIITSMAGDGMVHLSVSLLHLVIIHLVMLLRKNGKNAYKTLDVFKVGLFES